MSFHLGLNISSGTWILPNILQNYQFILQKGKSQTMAFFPQVKYLRYQGICFQYFADQKANFLEVVMAIFYASNRLCTFVLTMQVTAIQIPEPAAAARHQNPKQSSYKPSYSGGCKQNVESMVFSNACEVVPCVPQIFGKSIIATGKILWNYWDGKTRESWKGCKISVTLVV